MNTNNENSNYNGYPSSMDVGGGASYSGIDGSYSGSYSYGEEQGGEDGNGEYYYNDYPMQQQQQAMYNPYQQKQYDDFGAPSPGTWDEQSAAKRGDYFYNSEFSPEVYDHAISALEYDSTYDCMYLASTTQSMVSSRHAKAKNHRASLLLTYSNATPAKEYFMYSSVAGHPEAPLSHLRAVYESIYGFSKVGVSATVGLQQRRGRNNFYPPPHAYIPAYGGGEVAEIHLDAFHNPHAHHQEQNQQRGHMGIMELLPLQGGYVASISPSAVRIHSHGGLQLHDSDMPGMISGTIHPHCSSGMPNDGNAAATHITVGGLSMKMAGTLGENTAISPIRKNSRVVHPSIHCLDLWHGLRVVVSRSFKDTNKNSNSSSQVGVTCMATSHDKGSIVAGCTDGNIRLLDGSLRELATVRSHLGGVSSIAVSPDGNLVATTGYSSRASPKSRTDGTAFCSSLYAFPDPTVYVYDIRYLGRGGMSHPFSGVKGAPRHVCFVPDMEGCASNRFIVASGKNAGGMQIITPFESQNENTISFNLPPLQQGESITAMSQPVEDTGELALGTSMGRVIQFSLTGYNETKTKRRKEDLAMPPFYPDAPAVSLEPSLLQGNPGLRNGTTDEMRSLFSTYILQTPPTVTTIGEAYEDAMEAFGSLAAMPISTDQRRKVNPSLLKEATTGEKDYMLTVPISKLDIDILANQNSVSKNYKGKKLSKSLPNPNKILYNEKLSSMCYEDGWNGKGKQPQQQHHRGKRNNSAGGKQKGIPPRYQLQVRPGFKASGAFDPSQHNDSGLFPGWDYGASMPNAWVSPVLLLFYFIPEIRKAAIAAQFDAQVLGTKAYEKALSPELGFLFHQVESLSRYGLLYPSKDRVHRPKIGAWIPSNFLTFLSTMGEAEQMAVLDDSPAAVDLPRRPESFYRFLAYQLDKELCSLPSATLSSSKAKKLVEKSKLMDFLNGLDFLSSNQFIESKSTPPTQSMTRALTLDLNYDIFRPGTKKKSIRFGELLQHSLCRSTRLRAWNDKSRAYETIVQRKIATSLPQILTLSCACAGRKEHDGLWAWRTDYGGEPWLAEMIEVELLADGNVAVTEWHKAENGDGETSSIFRGKSSLPPEVSKLVLKASSKQKHRYRLESVLSYVRGCEDEGCGEEASGHHVLHSRVSIDYKRRALSAQAKEARKLAEEVSTYKSEEERELQELLLSSGSAYDEYVSRAKSVEDQLSSLEQDQEENSNDWIIYNGYKVSKTVVEDARAFHVPFKEPVLVVFQAVDENGMPLRDTKETNIELEAITKSLSESVMNPSSLSRHSGEVLTTDCLRALQKGRPLAFDAEFVSVQEEESAVTDSGQKEVICDTRHALGRISIFDCPTEKIMVDDHVLPREPVADFLTRFSGIIAEDLDVVRSRHRIISTRSAYLQLRYLLDRGCIFVGHGLKQDFSTVNLVVPPNQILDTVKIFHIPGRRYVSLRFLANFVFGRDMQQDTHDSVEDARTAYELYCKALEWKKEGIWEKSLNELYSYGEKTSWKLGMKDRF
mmetsp:Transcript_12503/g.29312  ORF Transcript_12503/g.29312 Transcript_12503/m.29312 type:complete len:1518 (-) Transcript_12503:118-4671(-)